ncbi:hypothetical protein L204_102944 [Cryptococcus depauperatus]
MMGTVTGATPPETPPLLAIPDLDVRWVHAGSQHLDLLPTPITSASTSYKAFSSSESLRIDRKWQEMSETEKLLAIQVWGKSDGEGVPSPKETSQDTARKDGSRSRSSSQASKSKQQDVHPIDAKIQDERLHEHTENRDGGKNLVEEMAREYKEMVNEAYIDEVGYDVVRGVPVSQDFLFEVWLPTLSLRPVFWVHTGPRVAVVRGTWFVQDPTQPCSWQLAEELERAYREIQPWQPSYKHELSTALSLGPSGEEKLKYTLSTEFGTGLGVIFENGYKGRLVSSGTLNYIARAFWSSIGAKPSGTYIYRGYKEACAASGVDASDGSCPKDKETRPTDLHRDDKDVHANLTGLNLGRDVSPSEQTLDRFGSVVESSINTVGATASEAVQGLAKGFETLHDQQLGESAERERRTDQRKAREEEYAPLVHDTGDSDACTDLILVIHGIGQQLAINYEAYNFVYAGNQLRQTLRKQSSNPALASIMRGRRCQILPVQWRASLDLNDQKTAEDAQHGMDNQFTISDITINQSIPYVRELTNAVLLDIPLFMSRHRQRMIEAVCLEANKLYRLWIARHPDFERRGRVHIIGHSLGSALVAHILSNQATKMPLFSQLPKRVIQQTKDKFLFNTSNLFLAGSPLGIFLHLDQAQIMPRKGRERTMHSPKDEALDRAGRFGCMAIDSLYNIFYHTDPIAYQLNAAVDSKIASQRPPLPITSVTAPFYAPFTDSINSISKYLPAVLGRTSNTKQSRPGAIRLPSGIEMTGSHGEERLEGSRGERRFSAMNPHGNVDFFLPSAGVSEYLDMVTAHLSYWTDSSFAAFLLAEIYSTRLDLMRTGMGLAGVRMAQLEKDTIAED